MIIYHNLWPFSLSIIDEDWVILSLSLVKLSNLLSYSLFHFFLGEVKKGTPSTCNIFVRRKGSRTRIYNFSLFQFFPPSYLERCKIRRFWTLNTNFAFPFNIIIKKKSASGLESIIEAFSIHTKFTSAAAYKNESEGWCDKIFIF